MLEWLERLAGALVLAITLLDVFLTVLHARAGSGLLAPRLARGVWRLLRALPLGSKGGRLNYCGPLQLVALVVMWGALLAFGAALLIHPGLGTGVRSSSGITDTDFITALLVGGSSMSIVGASDYGPAAPGYKLLFLFHSLVGMSVTSLTITYVMQVYTAVRSRNTLGLMVHGQSGDTGDAAELVARWGPRGRFDGGYNNLYTIAADMAAIKETHHFYPVLFYFRFEEVFYAPPRFLLVALEAVALVRTALDPRDLGWLQDSAALAELDGASAMLLHTLRESFPGHDRRPVDGARAHERWSRRYGSAVARMREAGIPLRADQDAGLREYVELRARWEPAIEGLADALCWRMKKWPGRNPGAARVSRSRRVEEPRRRSHAAAATGCVPHPRVAPVRGLARVQRSHAADMRAGRHDARGGVAALRATRRAVAVGDAPQLGEGAAARAGVVVGGHGPATVPRPAVAPCRKEAHPETAWHFSRPGDGRVLARELRR